MKTTLSGVIAGSASLACNVFPDYCDLLKAVSDLALIALGIFALDENVFKRFKKAFKR